jgi:RNA polymerase sigma-54 factor
MLKSGLQLKLGQRQAMTPQLQQAIRLLQLTAAELQQTVQDSLADNVLLEIDEPEEEFTAPSPQALPEPTARQDTSQEDAVSDDYWDEPLVDSHSSEPAWREDDGDLDYPDPSSGGLREHLVEQLLLAHLSPLDYSIGIALIDALNEDGYLTDSLDALAAALQPDLVASAAQLEAVLKVIQTFDPPGIGARSLSESLALQLSNLPADTAGLNWALRIARDHLALMAEGNLPALCRELDIDSAAATEALLLIRDCNPRPASWADDRAVDYVIPDVIVTRVGRTWRVDLNSVATPRIKLNADYAPLITREHSALRAQLQEARWLIKAIEMRHDTLLKVARTIVARQSAFLEQGDEAMQPLVLREIAESVGMHESTISRVTTGKFMLTPRGTYEFKHFFSSHIATADGTEVSSTAIRAKIRKLIAGEQPNAPLSDSRIAELLATDGAKVARRTVAKYREAMRIAPSSERRTPIAR